MAGEQVVQVEGRRVRLTNLDKVLYPATGTTKGEVIDYYTRIAPFLLPHLDRRPVTRKRWPEGTARPEFFAKDLERGAPSWLPRLPIAHSSGAKDYPLVEEVAALVYLAQVASLELHVPQWRFGQGDAAAPPDRLVLDLDPGPGVGLAECAEVARRAREILDGMGLAPLPVTSGSKGIHLYTHLDGVASSAAASDLARELARSLEADDPDLVVSQMTRSIRAGRVFVDWSQNNGKKTTIAPYSLRGREQPTVAAPRTWDELDDPDLRQLLLHEVLGRVAEHGDLFAALAPERTVPLSSYLAKRTVGRTPEPLPAHAGRSSGAPRFVVQEHHARRLHYDLRLERDGVLVSWAVPRGIPVDTRRNHLAVMTEPHPLEYLDFAGEIPAGQYGAGTMTVWDTGTYELEKWRDDEVIFTLTGAADGPLGRARFALIRTAGAGEKSQWLLHRMSAAGGATEPPGAAHTPAAPAPHEEAGGAPAPMLATSATAGVARAAAARWGAWTEFKWDGVRALLEWDGERMRVHARSGNDITARYPEISAEPLGLPPRPLLLDGEIVALDAENRPSFTRLQNRMHLSAPAEIARERSRTPATFFAFDLLRDGDTDLVTRPLSERRAALDALGASATGAWTVPPVAEDVDDALDAARGLGLEGVVVKDPRSPYRPGIRAEAWLKVKLTRTQDVVVGGIRPGRGGRTGTIGSLLLGIPEPDGLRYAGRVGTGFSDRELRRLEALLGPLTHPENPLVGVPDADAADAHWVRPEVVGEVEFAEFTPGGILRHARWRGLRPDRSPGDVTREP